MKYILSQLFIILAITTSMAQEAKVVIEDPLAKDGTELWFSRPIDTNPVHFIFKYDKEIFNNRRVLKSISVTSPLIIASYEPNVNMIICQGDSIHFLITKDALTHKVIPVFSGSNSKGNQYFNSIPLFSSVSAIMHLVLPIVKNASNFEDAVNRTTCLKKKLFYPMDSLLQLHEISNDYYQHAKLIGDDNFLCAIIHVCYNNLLENYQQDSIALHKEDIRKLIVYYCQRYNPWSEKYKNVDNVLNSEYLCRFIAEGLLSPLNSIHNLHLWNNLDTIYNLAPVDHQERIFAKELILKQKFGMISQADAQKDYIRFEKVFANSAFLPAIEASLSMAIDSSVAPYTFIKYDSCANTLNVLTKNSVASLATCIKQYFAGRAVLVDMWATYCVPCKQEFAYAMELHFFLSKYNIDLLYLSVDSKYNGKQWINDIKKYNLNGFHYFATDSIANELQKLLHDTTITIPHYLLFDAQGNLVDGNLPRPSETNRLYETIIKKLRL